MGSFKEKPDGISQLEALMDLLVDLQIVQPTNGSSEASELSQVDVKNHSEELSDQSIEECLDPQIEDTPIITPNSNLLNQQPESVEPQEETTNQSILSDENLAPEEKISALQGLQNLLIQSTLPEKEREEPTSKWVSAEVELERVESLATSVEFEDNSPITSELKKANQEQELKNKNQDESELNYGDNLAATAATESNLSIRLQKTEEKLEKFTSESIVLTEEMQIDEENLLLDRLQRLLVPAEILASRELIVNIKQKVTTLEHHIYEPAELTNLLLPLITDILTIKVTEAREEVVRAIAPVVDGMIQAKTQQDKVAIISVLSPLISDAVAERVNSFPGEIAQALAPEIGIAIKQQISLERDAMVDALYPVIGSIIAKYMTEVLKAINEKVETALSPEGVMRKFRAKAQGVSEAELMLKEATPFTIKAVFLIHKGSGLVICEAQSRDNHHLESEMVAGMLTAIRSFVNDCIAQTGDISEIDQINYGSSKIILEVAGYCYLAVVIQGSPPKSFMRQMREALARIVQSHSKAIELFDGDPDNVPEQVSTLVGELTRLGNSQLSVAKDKERKPPVTLLALATVLSLIFIPWGIFQLGAQSNRRIEADTSLALSSEPDLAIYPLKVEADGNNLKLTGKLPNQYLREKAEQIAQKVQPTFKIKNAIIAVKAPADPVLAAAEVKRLTSIFNKMDGVEISSSYDAGKVTVEGTVLQVADTQKITAAFEQIPGVESVTNTVQLQTEAIASRIYFDRASSQLKPAELAKIIQLKEFLQQYSTKGIKIIGRSDSSGTSQENQRLAIGRAKTVRDVFVSQGIDTRRLQVAGTTSLPRGVDADQPLWLSRCVEFEIITP
ncbi:MAG: OmpA family protein [Potamolinea sp.]